MTRFWPSGEPITVVCDGAATPLAFSWRSQNHPVQEVLRRWRVDEAWWRRRTFRDYYQLITQTGMLVVLFRDLVEDRWYLQRLYD